MVDPAYVEAEVTESGMPAWWWIRGSGSIRGCRWCDLLLWPPVLGCTSSALGAAMLRGGRTKWPCSAALGLGRRRHEG